MFRSAEDIIEYDVERSEGPTTIEQRVYGQYWNLKSVKFRNYASTVLTANRAAVQAQRTKRSIRLRAHAILLVAGIKSAPGTKSSSKANGTASKMANGHPTIAPVANHKVAIRVRTIGFGKVGGVKAGDSDGGNIACAAANMVVYIANDDGKNAGDMSVSNSI